MKIALSAALALALVPSFLAVAAADDPSQTDITELPPIQTGKARKLATEAAAERKSAPKTLDETVAAARIDFQGEVWTEDVGNGGFDPATRAQIRIMSSTNPRDGMQHFKVLFDPKLGVRNNSFEFAAMNRDVRLLRLRGVKKFIALEYGTASQYYDLTNFAHYVQHVFDPSLSYRQTGGFSVVNNQMQDVDDVDVMTDILTSRMKIKSDDPMIATLRGRVKKNAHGRPFVINGDAKAIYLGVGEEGMTIWPDERKSGQ